MSFLQKLLSFFIYHIVNLYCKTWRYKLHNRKAYDNLIKNNKKVVMAIWHDQLLACTFLHRNEGMVTIASDSKDGEIISYALKKWKFNVARGSSTRGGLKAALNAIKLSKNYLKPCAVTVDGPKGPRHSVKEGAVFIAKKLDCVILIGLLHTKKYKRFSSWDKFILPLPFAKIDVTYSNPIYINNSTDENEIKKDTEILEKTMKELTSEVSPLFV